MKLVALIFIYLVWAIFLITYANTSESIPAVVFPTLESPDIDFIDVSDGCGGFIDCLEYIGAVLFNIGAGIIFLVLFIINLIVYVFQILAILLEVSFTGIDGAPWQFNTTISTVSAAIIAMLVFRLIRSGKSTD